MGQPFIDLQPTSWRAGSGTAVCVGNGHFVWAKVPLGTQIRDASFFHEIDVNRRSVSL